MALSDRIWHWLISLVGLCLVGAGVAIVAYLHMPRTGVSVIGAGFIVIFLGMPSQAQRNGYRE